MVSTPTADPCGDSPEPSSASIKVTVVPRREDPATTTRAREVAALLSLPCGPSLAAATADTPNAALSDVVLEVGLDGLQLHWLTDPLSTRTKRSKPIRVGFAHLSLSPGPGASRRQPLGRAVGLHKERGLRICDATAGYGEDSWLLAGLGCEVTAVERSPLLALLLEDALARLQGDLCRIAPQPEGSAHESQQHDDPKPDHPKPDDPKPDDPKPDHPQQTQPKPGGDSAQIARRIRLVHADAQSFLQTSEFECDVVYLDPMFPPRSKSALESKAMRLCRCLVGEDVDAEQLLEVALASRCRRVVVKRPRHAQPLLSGVQHHYSGRGLRYDVYLTGSRSSES